jgi:MFS transporter, DHA3 family, macrolide efflux protein
LVREVVPSQRLLEANTSAMTTVQLGMIIGASSSGFIIAGQSPVLVMLLNSISYLISAALTMFMKTANHNKTSIKPGYLDDLRNGWRYLRGNRALIFPYLGGLMLFSTISTVNVLLVPFVRQVLQLDADALGLIDAAWAVGAVLAGLLLTRVVARVGRAAVMTWAPLLVGASLLLFASSNSLPLALLAYAFGGFFIRANVVYRTTAQENTDLAFQGRVESLVGAVASFVALSIYLLMGLMQATVSPRWLYLLQAAVLLALTLWALLVLRPLRPQRSVAT